MLFWGCRQRDRTGIDSQWLAFTVPVRFIALRIQAISNHFPCKTCRAIMRKCVCTPREITHKTHRFLQKHEHVHGIMATKSAIVIRTLRKNWWRPPRIKANVSPRWLLTKLRICMTLSSVCPRRWKCARLSAVVLREVPLHGGFLRSYERHT